MLMRKIILSSLAVISFQNADATRHNQLSNAADQVLGQANLNDDHMVEHNEPAQVLDQANLNDDHMVEHNEPVQVLGQANLNDDRIVEHNEPAQVLDQNNLNHEERAQDNQDNPALSLSESLRQYRLRHSHPMLENILQNPSFGETIDRINLENMPGKDVAIIVDIRKQSATSKGLIIIYTNHLNDSRNKILESASLRKSIYLELERDQRMVWMAEIDSGFFNAAFDEVVNYLRPIFEPMMPIFDAIEYYIDAFRRPWNPERFPMDPIRQISGILFNHLQ